MEVARKDYYQLQEPQEQLQRQPKKQKKKAPKSYRFEKVMATAGIVTILVLSLSLLLRYASITEARHDVHGLSKQLEQLENQREKLKVEMEKVSKSMTIEAAAKERLNMQYPSKEQVFYVAVDPTKVALMNNEIDKKINEGEVIGLNTNLNPLKKMFHKISGMFNI
ncbi:cell division protein FtsL [Alkaliphilus hydrothermalis]|uniref:Cell division protein FtsL n=1 Tax=Alkaliphilus hydrothermalis TaxID=1482730 RepID=A0ABS2NNR6_9FIRM|nr:cell division protein FtsL [Alkaliphilus hydrothermalis]MBM7614594.1 cell division protein FtsL [Alkaliphilus hydrothermalis]